MSDLPDKERIDELIEQGVKENFESMENSYREKIDDLNDKWQRALADYQNLERRTQVEISQRVSSKTNDLLLNFINIYEDFLRAENSLSKENIDTNGIQAVIKNMENLLRGFYLLLPLRCIAYKAV